MHEMSSNSLRRPILLALLFTSVVFAATAQSDTTSATIETTQSNTSADELPSSFELKVGDTTRDAKTSHAVELILQRCAKAYASASYYYASGRYIQAYKSKRLGENLNDATIEILYRR